MAESRKYFDEFSGYQDMVDQWSGANAVKDEEVILASYDCPPYEGYATCVYKRDGKLFEVHDSHCSCYGLDRFEPEETSWEALLMQTWPDDQRAVLEAAHTSVPKES